MSVLVLRRCAAALAAAVLLLAGLGPPGIVKADYTYGWILPESANTYLEWEDISNLPLQVVCYAKNEIFAREGRQFASLELQGYFDSQYWYTPVYAPDAFPMDLLNTYEAANVQILAEREAQLGGYVLDTADYSYDAVYAWLGGTSFLAASEDTGVEEAWGMAASDYDVDPDSYIFYDSDSRLLSVEETAPLSLQELCYARWEIYARHGRLFQSAELQNYFDQKDWYWGYLPPDQFPEESLGSVETQNIALLADQEYTRSSSGYVTDQAGYSYAGIGSYMSPQKTENRFEQEEYLFWDSNARYLTMEDVAGLSQKEACYARNEIYARRGYVFVSQELRDYFSHKSWYRQTVPAAQFSVSVFNDFEAANIEFLKNYEYSLDPNGYQVY